MPVIKLAYFGRYGCIILGTDDQGWSTALCFTQDGIAPKTRWPSEQVAKMEFESLMKKYNAKLAQQN